MTATQVENVSYAAAPDIAEVGRPLSRVPALRPLSLGPTYAGVGVAAFGFVLIAFAWGAIAGKTNVALQLPYLVSGGMTGLGLVLVGVTIVSIAARRRDAALRLQQTELLASALAELSAALDERRA